MLRALILLIALADPALAHPHVFINASVTATIDDQNRLTDLRIRWDYDDYVSLLLATEKGADNDNDGTLTATELEPLQGFDMAWVDGFDGDTTLRQAERVIPLQTGPLAWVTGWQEAHLWSEHGRKPVAPVDLSAGPATIVIHDVTDYTAFTLIGVKLANAPPGCRIEILEPDTSAASSEFGSLLRVFFFLDEVNAAPAQITTEQQVRISCEG